MGTYVQTGYVQTGYVDGDQTVDASGYPVWSGINTGWLNDAEINGIEPTPGLAPGAFSSARIPILLGGFAGLDTYHADVRLERQSKVIPSEDLTHTVPETPAMVAAGENRAMNSGRAQRGSR